MWKLITAIVHVVIHTWTVMETGVTGSVSFTGQNPTLGTLTRAAEAQTPQIHNTRKTLETPKLFCQPTFIVEPTQTGFASAILGPDDFKALPGERVKDGVRAALGHHGPAGITQQSSTVSTDLYDTARCFYLLEVNTTRCL